MVQSPSSPCPTPWSASPVVGCLGHCIAELWPVYFAMLCRDASNRFKMIHNDSNIILNTSIMINIINLCNIPQCLSLLWWSGVSHSVSWRLMFNTTGRPPRPWLGAEVNGVERSICQMRQNFSIFGHLWTISAQTCVELTWNTPKTSWNSEMQKSWYSHVNSLSYFEIFWNVSSMHFSKLIRAGIADPYLKIFKFKQNQTMIIIILTSCDTYDSVSLSRFVQLFSRLQRAEGSCSGRVLYSGHSAGTTPVTNTNTHTHTTYLLTYTWVAHTGTRENKDQKNWKILRPCGCLPFVEACQRWRPGW